MYNLEYLYLYVRRGQFLSLKTVFAQICPTGKTLAPITGSAYPHQQDSFQGLQCRELHNLQTDPLVLYCPLMGGRT